MAEAAEQLLAATAWLPAPLRTPTTRTGKAAAATADSKALAAV